MYLPSLIGHHIMPGSQQFRFISCTKAVTFTCTGIDLADGRRTRAQGTGRCEDGRRTPGSSVNTCNNVDLDQYLAFNRKNVRRMNETHVPVGCNGSKLKSWHACGTTCIS